MPSSSAEVTIAVRHPFRIILYQNVQYSIVALPSMQYPPGIAFRRLPAEESGFSTAILA